MAKYFSQLLAVGTCMAWIAAANYSGWLFSISRNAEKQLDDDASHSVIINLLTGLFALSFVSVWVILASIHRKLPVLQKAALVFLSAWFVANVISVRFYCRFLGNVVPDPEIITKVMRELFGDEGRAVACKRIQHEPETLKFVMMGYGGLFIIIVTRISNLYAKLVKEVAVPKEVPAKTASVKKNKKKT